MEAVGYFNGSPLMRIFFSNGSSPIVLLFNLAWIEPVMIPNDNNVVQVELQICDAFIALAFASISKPLQSCLGAIFWTTMIVGYIVNGYAEKSMASISSNARGYIGTLVGMNTKSSVKKNIALKNKGQLFANCAEARKSPPRSLFVAIILIFRSHGKRFKLRLFGRNAYLRRCPEKSGTYSTTFSFRFPNARDCFCHEITIVLGMIEVDKYSFWFTRVPVDIRDLISLEDVMEELNLGPNGGLVYCMEHLEENLDDWLADQLEGYLDDDYLVFDCPGQIELYSHIPVFRTFVDQLKRWNYNVCAVYLLDSQFVSDITKYLSGCMASLSAMVQLELPHVNILTKMDLVKNKKDIEKFLDPDTRLLLSDLNQHMAPRFEKLNRALAELIDDYSMVNFLPLDITKENSIQYILSYIDNAIQFGEDADVK
ncbi:hypothetical protein KI387_003258, partial [Taxus chinensis]